MKLKLTLPAKPGFLHTLAGLDIIALILVFPLLGPSFAQQTGIEVTVHESPWRLSQMDNPIVITLGVGEGKPLWVNKNLVAMEDLEAEIQRLRSEEGGEGITTAVIRADVAVPSGVEKEVINRLLKMGLNCGIAGRPINAD